MEAKPHVTTLVVDYDDTIATTFNRDWENAEPNQPLIDKLNELHSLGWTIHIVTARGQLSCGGDSEKADSVYRKQIEEWLRLHRVSYDTLSFQKKLAAYYIDDKGITPEQFVKKFDRINLQKGWSGASVYYDAVSDCVYKTASNSHSAIQWYSAAASLGYETPHIHSIIGSTIRMSRLPEYTGNVNDVIKTIISFGDHQPCRGNSNFDLYVSRCVGRVTGILSSDTLLRIKESLLRAMEKTPFTFGHGDCSSYNIMGSDANPNKPAFIDPINDDDLYSSYIIDLGKYYGSIDIFKQDESIKDEILRCIPQEIHSVVKTHAVGHMCRCLPYAPTDEDKKHITTLIENQTYVL